VRAFGFEGRGKGEGKGDKAKAMDSRENVTTAVRKAIQQARASKAKKEESQKEREMVTKEKAKDRGVGEGIWRVDEEGRQGDWKREQPEEETIFGSI
jgi:hypothetical protein